MTWLTEAPGANAIDCGSDADTLRFTADAKGGPERLWFDAHLQAVPGEGPLTIELHHSQSMLGGGDSHALHPVWHVDGADWRRLPAGVVEVLDDGRKVVRWQVARPRRHARLAACYPYRLDDLAECVAATGLRCDTIGVSAEGRLMPRVCNRVDSVGSQRPGVFLLARQHAAESPGSWVLDGMLRALAEVRDDDPQVWALPFVDLDGVMEGRYGKNHWPLDCNRAWYSGGLRHEVLLAMQEARRWSQRCRPLLLLDLHAPGYGEEGSYLFRMEESSDAPSTAFIAAAQEELGDLASERFARVSSYMQTFATTLGIAVPPTAKTYFRNLGVTCALTLETSYQKLAGRPAERDDYRHLGKCLVEALRCWCAAQPEG